MTKTPLRTLGLSLALLFSFAAAPALAQNDIDPALLPPDHPDAVVEFAGPERVVLESADGTRHDFTVLVAATPRAQQRGLMFREELAPDEGMLFFYAQPNDVGIWMKNTLIPLDILFVKPDGTITKIARNAQPGSLASINAGTPVAVVLEIPGGRAQELDVQPGSVVRHLVFGNLLED